MKEFLGENFLLETGGPGAWFFRSTRIIINKYSNIYIYVSQYKGFEQKHGNHEVTSSGITIPVVEFARGIVFSTFWPLCRNALVQGHDEEVDGVELRLYRII